MHLWSEVDFRLRPIMTHMMEIVLLFVRCSCQGVPCHRLALPRCSNLWRSSDYMAGSCSPREGLPGYHLCSPGTGLQDCPCVPLLLCCKVTVWLASPCRLGQPLKELMKTLLPHDRG